MGRWCHIATGRGPPTSTGEDMGPSRVRWLGLALVLALVASSCGDSDDDGSAATETTEATETTAGGETTAADGANTTGAPDGDAAGEPIRIGALTSLTGNFAPWGVQVRDGMRLAVDEINADGGVDGRPLELVVGDDQSERRGGRPAIERLVEDGVVAVGGVISSDVGLATARLAEESGDAAVPRQGRVASAILTPASRYTFRTCLPAAPMVAGPIAQYAEAGGPHPGRRDHRRLRLGPGDRGGACETEFGELEGVELQIEVAPVPEQDFTTYLRSLEAFDPELIVATGHPPGSGPITTQSADLGLDVPVTGAYSVAVAGHVRRGRRGHRHATPTSTAPTTRARSTRSWPAGTWRCRDNEFMEDDAVAGYGIVQMVAQAVAEVGDDPAAIAEYLHEQTFDLPGYAFEMGWTEWGELAAAQPLFGDRPRPGARGRERGRRVVSRDADRCPIRSSRSSRPDTAAVTILELDGVEKHFGGLPAVDGVTSRSTRARSSPSSARTARARRTLLKADQRAAPADRAARSGSSGRT